MAKYAETTKVPVSRSKAEIEKLVTRFGADTFLAGNDENCDFVMFRIRGMFIRLAIDRVENPQEMRRLWRSLVLVVKAKLAAVDDGVVEFVEEFMPYVVMADGQTFAKHALPAIEDPYEQGRLPDMRPMLGLPSPTS